jgi:hypothetical protein
MDLTSFTAYTDLDYSQENNGVDGFIDEYDYLEPFHLVGGASSPDLDLDLDRRDLQASRYALDV